MPAKSKKENFIYHLKPIHRSLIALAVGTAVYFIAGEIPLLLRLLLSWLGFAFVYNSLCWIVICNAPVELIKKKADEEDGNKTFVFVMILVATFASMFAVLMLIISDSKVEEWILITVVISTMILSWFLVHTMFVFHYAHLYYDEGRNGQGLDFPGDEDPDYLDFAYFSFVLGCTFQVSDVEISEKSIRRLAFVHGLLAFALNTFVVALTINIIAGLSK